MNTTLIRSPMPALLVAPLAVQHRVCHRWSQRDHDGGAPRTSFTDGEDVAGSRLGRTSIPDFGTRVRPGWLESP